MRLVDLRTLSRVSERRLLAGILTRTSTARAPGRGERGRAGWRGRFGAAGAVSGASLANSIDQTAPFFFRRVYALLVGACSRRLCAAPSARRRCTDGAGGRDAGMAHAADRPGRRYWSGGIASATLLIAVDAFRRAANRRRPRRASAATPHRSNSSSRSRTIRRPRWTRGAGPRRIPGRGVSVPSSPA